MNNDSDDISIIVDDDDIEIDASAEYGSGNDSFSFTGDDLDQYNDIDDDAVECDLDTYRKEIDAELKCMPRYSSIKDTILQTNNIQPVISEPIQNNPVPRFSHSNARVRYDISTSDAINSTPLTTVSSPSHTPVQPKSPNRHHPYKRQNHLANIPRVQPHEYKKVPDFISAGAYYNRTSHFTEESINDDYTSRRFVHANELRPTHLQGMLDHDEEYTILDKIDASIRRKIELRQNSSYQFAILIVGKLHVSIDKILENGYDILDGKYKSHSQSRALPPPCHFHTKPLGSLNISKNIPTHQPQGRGRGLPLRSHGNPPLSSGSTINQLKDESNPSFSYTAPPGYNQQSSNIRPSRIRIQPEEQETMTEEQPFSYDTSLREKKHAEKMKEYKKWASSSFITGVFFFRPEIISAIQSAFTNLSSIPTLGSITPEYFITSSIPQIVSRFADLVVGQYNVSKTMTSTRFHEKHTRDAINISLNNAIEWFRAHVRHNGSDFEYSEIPRPRESVYAQNSSFSSMYQSDPVLVPVRSYNSYSFGTPRLHNANFSEMNESDLLAILPPG